MNTVTNLNPRKRGVDKRRSERKRILQIKSTAIKGKILFNVVLVRILLSNRRAIAGKSGSLGAWEREGGHWRATQKVERASQFWQTKILEKEGGERGVLRKKSRRMAMRSKKQSGMKMKKWRWRFQMKFSIITMRFDERVERIGSN